MRRTASLVGAIPVMLGAALLIGCGGEAKKDAVADTKAETKSAGDKKKAKGGKTEELTAATDGVLKGRVVLDGGDAPKMMAIEAMAKHQDAKVCLAGDETEKSEQTWIVGKDKGVANVVVRLLPPAGKKFKNVAPAKDQVEIDQPHCAYVPNVVAVLPGQKLLVKNTADVSHNTKAVGEPGTNEDKNVTIAAGGSQVLEFAPQKQPVVLSCQVHPWMQAKVYVTDNPLVAVTDKDGNFEIRNVPTGVELMLVGDHGAGAVEGGKTGVAITLKAGENSKNLKISAK